MYEDGIYVIKFGNSTLLSKCSEGKFQLFGVDLDLSLEDHNIIVGPVSEDELVEYMVERY